MLEMFKCIWCGVQPTSFWQAYHDCAVRQIFDPNSTSVQDSKRVVGREEISQDCFQIANLTAGAGAILLEISWADDSDLTDVEHGVPSCSAAMGACAPTKAILASSHGYTYTAERSCKATVHLVINTRTKVVAIWDSIPIGVSI
jgi:hypothetical protein